MPLVRVVELTGDHIRMDTILNVASRHTEHRMVASLHTMWWNRLC